MPVNQYGPIPGLPGSEGQAGRPSNPTPVDYTGGS